MLPIALGLTTAAAQSLDPAARSAVHLLRQSTQPSNDGLDNALLRSIRELRDPALAPLYSHLLASPHEVLKLHGILSLAEVTDPRQVNLTQVMTIKDVRLMAQLVGEALDRNLLNNDQIAQMLKWADLNEGVKVILATHLISNGHTVDQSILINALESNNLSRRAWAMMLLLQTDSSTTTDQLTKILDTEDPKRDEIRANLLTAAIINDFDRSAPWAAQVRTEADVNSNLAAIALRVGLRFGDAEAIAAWCSQYQASTNATDKTRLAVIALQTAQWLDPSVVGPLITEQDQSGLLAAIGQAAVAIARNRAVGDAVAHLIQLNHPLTSRWALTYARHSAAAVDARQILHSTIVAADGPEPFVQQRIGYAIMATRYLCELDPDTAMTPIRIILADPKTSNLLRQAILVGLTQCRTDEAHTVVVGLKPFTDRNSRNLVLVLLARKHDFLSDQQMQDLSVLVRGGARLKDPLRIQAAWAYLRRTGQEKEALKLALEH